MSFTVMTDTSANVPTSVAAEKGIKIIAYPYFIDVKTYFCDDTDAFDGDDFYAKIRGGTVVTTSQVTPARYVEFFEPELAAGNDIIYVSISSGISGSFNSANVAAAELLERFPERRIEVIDAIGAALGAGLLAMQAADMKNDGAAFEDAVAAVRATVPKMFNVFTVDDLMHLRRGGRLSNWSAIVGTVLKIKPILKGNHEGKIVAFKKVRGRAQSIRTLAEMYDELVVEPEKQVVGITQAGCREDAAMLESLLREHRPPKEILNVEYEPVTGSHVGPGALALFFVANDRVRYYGD